MGLNWRGWHIASIMPPPDDGHWCKPYTWCRSQLSEADWGYQGEGVFEFKKEQDYLIFILRWG